MLSYYRVEASGDFLLVNTDKFSKTTGKMQCRNLVRENGMTFFTTDWVSKEHLITKCERVAKKNVPEFWVSQLFWGSWEKK